MADGRVVIDTALNNKGFTRGINNMKGELGGLTTIVKKLGAVIGVAFGVKALVDFGKASIELGSNIAEVQNVVDVAFKDMSYKIEDFAKTSIKSFGMSKLSAKKTASTYMAMARGMGIAEDQASDMAVSLTGLTGDVASFFNISQELADVKLKSVFTGETETLKDLGVVMTQANLKAYALSKGISKDIDKMTQAELVGLRYNFVMDQLALAHGDFARTSDSWANQTRILSEQWKEFMSIIGQALITVLRPLVVTLNSVVASMIDVANTVNTVITSLFGGTSTQMQQTQQNAEGVGGAIEGSVGDQNDLTDAVEETNKAEKKSLAAFDEINKLTAEASANEGEAADPDAPSTGGITSEDGEKVEGLSEKMTALIESLRSGFQELKSWVTDFFKPFRESWDTHGAAVIAAAKNAVSNILDLLKSVGSSFMDIWSNGTGVTILNTIHSIITKIFDIVEALADRLRIAWEANGNGEAIWQSILNIVQSILNFVDRLANATLDWVNDLDFEPAISAFSRLLEALEPLVDLILDGLAWAYENVLLPLGKWVIEDAAPAALDLLTAAIDALTPVVAALQPSGRWLWEEFLIPIGQWTGDAIIQGIEWLTDKLMAFGDWASEHKEIIETVAIIIGSFLAAWAGATAVSGIIAGVTTALIALASAGGLVTIVTTAFGSAVAFLTSPITIIIAAVGALIAIIVLLVKNWDKVKAAAGAAWDFIVDKWEAAGEWITVNVLDPVVNAFDDAMDLIFSIVEGFVNFFIGGINAIIDGLNSISFDVPDWVPLIGGNTFGFNISKVPELQIPRLAKGAVIPPNREFMAVLGDQKSGTNIEAPVSEIEAAVTRGVAAAGASQAPSNITIILELDGQRVGRGVYTLYNRESQRVGARLTGG